VFIIEQEKVRLVGWPAPGLLLLVRQDGAFAFYDTATRAERCTFGGKPGYVQPRAWLSGGRWLLAHGAVWDLAPTADALAAGRSPVPEPVKRYEWDGVFLIHCLYAFSQDGRLALRCVGKDVMAPTVQQLLSVPEFEVRGVCPGPAPCPSYAAALSNRFVVWFEQKWPPYKQALVYSLQSGALTASIEHTRGINCAVFSRDGRRLATAASGTVRVCDPESGECVRQFKAYKGNVRAIEFHPSGRFLAVSCHDESIRFADVASGRELVLGRWRRGPPCVFPRRLDGRCGRRARGGRVGCGCVRTHLRFRAYNAPVQVSLPDGLIAEGKMEQGPRLGQLIEDGDRRRDAIHIAVAPVTAAERLLPGQHVGLVRRGDVELVGPCGDTIGIVDPFLEAEVEPGQRFWLFLYPGTITALRHVWTHPAFTKAAATVKEKLL
jgi:hypothetical protein